jgi:indole-3-glycerol phosphate synthase/phosphoribosylanthranilate isomerase
MHDILSEILRQREVDYREKGASFGTGIPSERQRPINPFLVNPGLVLEIKRASPSKGDIAIDLEPLVLAGHYRTSKAIGISVLTEQRYFKGSLDDLVSIGSVIQDIALLRKDFLLYEDEIEISYLVGADAVLLIARILPEGKLRSMASLCREFGMTPFVEVHNDADLKKLAKVLRDGDAIAGVNARNLKTFLIDPLVPAQKRELIPCKAIYESGAISPGACRYARSLGYEGMLIGEAVARNPQKAPIFVDAFASMKPNRRGSFWKQIAKRREDSNRPLVKICGITNREDFQMVASFGADLIGFVFAKSPRKANGEVVREVVAEKRMMQNPPLMVGVITELDSNLALEAIDLAMKGELDALQCHGKSAPCMLQELARKYGDQVPACYAAIGIGEIGDVKIVEDLLVEGEPRVLCDAQVGNQSGGTGVLISDPLLRSLEKTGPLWIAGGLGVDTISEVVRIYRPELVDVSSRLESAPGKKDPRLIKRFFEEVNNGYR